MAGEVVPFGPDMSARDDIVLACEKIFAGFMDERYMAPKKEARESFFNTESGFDCFKQYASNGEKQKPRPHELRDFGSTASKPRILYGTTNGFGVRGFTSVRRR